MRRRKALPGSFVALSKPDRPPLIVREVMYLLSGFRSRELRLCPLCKNSLSWELVSVRIMCVATLASTAAAHLHRKGIRGMLLIFSSSRCNIACLTQTLGRCVLAGIDCSLTLQNMAGQPCG